MITARTGLLLDPYFSGTKVKWLLDTVEGARARARRGELAFGTVDSYLIWRLTGGAVHVTDATNAARTLLYDIREGRWDPEICDLLDVPMEMLPEVRDCAADFGMARADLFGREIPILGVAGDQQAATVGQACFTPGMLKSTYGTGCFALLNTGDASWRAATACSAPSPTSSTGARPTRSRARSSLPAPWCNGCATGSRSSARPPRPMRSPRPPIPASTSISCRPSPGSARPTGTPRPRGDLRPHPQLRPRRVRPRGARERRLPDPRPLRGDAPRLAGRGRNRCCASTAA
jgi:hypothetical protein